MFNYFDEILEFDELSERGHEYCISWSPSLKSIVKN